MAAPTRVSYNVPASGNHTTTTTPKTTAAFDVVAGDLIVLFGGSESDDALLANPSASGGSVTWRLRQFVNTGSASWGGVRVWTGAVGSTATGITVSVANTGTARNWGMEATLWRNHGGVGNTAKANADGAPSATITGLANNSALQTMDKDWNGLSGASRTWLSVNGSAMTENSGGYVLESTNGSTMYSAYAPDTGTLTSATVGLSAPTGQHYSIVGIEILAVVPPGPEFDSSFDSAAFHTSAGATTYAAAGTTAAVSGNAGTVTLNAVASATVAGTSATTGAVTSRLLAASTSAATSATTATVTALLPTSSTTAGASTTTGAVTILPAPVTYAAAGTTAAVSGAAGTVTTLARPSSTTAGISGTTGTVTALAQAAATTSAVTTTTASPSIVGGPATYAASATTTVTSSSAGAVTARLTTSATTAATGATAGTVTSILAAAGITTVTATTSGLVTAALRASGVTAALSATLGDATVLHGTPAPDVTVLKAVEHVRTVTLVEHIRKVTLAEHIRVITATEHTRTVTVQGGTMILSKFGKDYYGQAITTSPAVSGTAWEASFDGGTTWVASTVWDGVPAWLVAGPNCPSPGAATVLPGDTLPQVRLIENPVVVVKTAARIYVR